MYSGVGDASGNPLSLADKKELVAVALEKRDMRNLVGTARVEYMKPKAVAALPAPPNHGIGFIGAVAKEAGFEHDGTFGGVLEFFGLPRGSKEAQDVLQKYESRSSHLVEGTMMAKYLQENRIKVLDAKQQNDFYLQGEATGLKLKE